MPKILLDDIKARKDFYRDNFRRVVMWLFISLIILATLAAILIYRDVIHGAPGYYATNNAGFIIPLKGMDRPNDSSQALLAPDPKEETGTKVIPS